jgi:hypothetical protein
MQGCVCLFVSAYTTPRLTHRLGDRAGAMRGLKRDGPSRWSLPEYFHFSVRVTLCTNVVHKQTLRISLRYYSNNYSKKGKNGRP